MGLGSRVQSPESRVQGPGSKIQSKGVFGFSVFGLATSILHRHISQGIAEMIWDQKIAEAHQLKLKLTTNCTSSSC